MFFKYISNGYITAFGDIKRGVPVSRSEYIALLACVNNKPVAPEGYAYMLRADTLDWELVELPPVPIPEPTPDEALTRYANELTGENDPDLVSATETLITKFTEE